MAMKKFWPIVLSVLFLDQLSKFIIQKSVEVGSSIKLLPFFSIVHFRNTGTLFGMLKSAQWFFILFSLAVIIFIVVKRKSFEPKTHLLSAFILAGALGNLIDRLIHGAVIDFIYFHFWPAFNVADASISISVVLLLVYEFKRK